MFKLVESEEKKFNWRGGCFLSRVLAVERVNRVRISRCLNFDILCLSNSDERRDRIA